MGYFKSKLYLWKNSRDTRKRIAGVYKRVRTFRKDIGLKMNVIAWLESELNNMEVVILHFIHYAMEIPLKFGNKKISKDNKIEGNISQH